MFKRKVRAKTCFLMGVVSGVLYLVTALLTMLGQGAASFLQISAFAFQGAMLLFLATTEAGPAGKAKRYKLLGLFALLVVSLPNLPPLSTLAAALVMPLLLLMYYTGPARTANVVGLLALGLVYCGVDLWQQVALAAVPQPTAGQVLPRFVLMALVGVGRAYGAWLLFRQERDKRVDPGEDTRPKYG